MSLLFLIRVVLEITAKDQKKRKGEFGASHIHADDMWSTQL